MSITTTKSGWVLETQSTGYAFGLNPAGRLIHSYWGIRLPQLGDYPAPSSSKGWASFSGPAQLEPEEGRVGQTPRFQHGLHRVPLTPVARVDYIWCTPEIRVEAAWVGADAGSDHLPVFARLDL